MMNKKYKIGDKFLGINQDAKKTIKIIKYDEKRHLSNFFDDRLYYFDDYMHCDYVAFDKWVSAGDYKYIGFSKLNNLINYKFLNE